jgi:outer membrane protein OmpA-like peptidoglycan-associated protein
MAMNGKTTVPRLLLCLALSAGTARAQEDVEGSKDHPAVKRYPGSTIFGGYEEKEFEAADFPVSAGTCQHAEGKYQTALYLYPARSSCTQVLRNYQNALQAAKATLYTGTALPEACNSWDVNGSSVARWLTAVGTGPRGGATWIFIGCVEGALDGPAGPILVVDVAPMAQKVEIDADYLAGEIDKTGRVAVYGITFATGKSDITGDSAKVLAEIASLLERKPDWRLRVEGHTDNVGSARSNQELSTRRAQAVKAWLGTKHGVKPERLESQGLGDARPVADNGTEQGRAKNRRVELVKL